MTTEESVQDAEILSEVSFDFIKKAIGAADSLSRGNKGFLAVEGLIAAGYAKNPARLRAIYQNNKQAFNDLMEEVDTQKVAELFSPEIQQTIDDGLQNKVMPFLIGAGIGAGITLLVKSST